MDEWKWMKLRIDMNEIEMDKMKLFSALSLMDILSIWNVQKWAFQMSPN